jgi:drug/metabolite transporter (DMT)-like permease
MGIVAPVAAVVTAVLPVIATIFVEGAPAFVQLVGFGLALLAVWLISAQHGGAGQIRAQELGLAVLAGTGFGIFLLLIGRTSAGAILWPLAAARVASISLLGVVVMATSPLKKLPAVGLLPIILAGIFDAVGNVFFALASQTGRLDVAAILASLYPAATIALARILLKEQLLPQQWGGVAAALLAIVLISA